MDLGLTLNIYYNYLLSMTVFTSTAKFSRLLSFQRAFMQISATIKLCFQGLSTFFVEFALVFGGFSAFFYFILRTHLENFRDFIRTLENTMAMSIGKFNFGALRAADVLAAWVFFVFSLVVNLVLINMMMAIINMAFEEIKEKRAMYESKFQLIEYAKRSMKEIVGTRYAKPIFVKYKRPGQADDSEEEEEMLRNQTSDQFANKTDAFLKYVEEMYLAGDFEDANPALKAKMGTKNSVDKETAHMGFDALFGANEDDDDGAGGGSDRNDSGDERDKSGDDSD